MSDRYDMNTLHKGMGVVLESAWKAETASFEGTSPLKSAFAAP